MQNKDPNHTLDTENDPYFVPIDDNNDPLPQPSPLGASSKEIEDSSSTYDFRLPPKSSKLMKRFLIISGILLFIGIAYETVSALAFLFSLHWVLGYLGGALLILLFIWGGRSLLEMRNQRLELDSVAQLREHSEKLNKDRSFGHGKAFVNKLNQFYQNKPQQHLLTTASQSLADYNNDKEVVQHVEENFVVKLDTEAKKRITKYSQQTALMVAASPLAIVDMGLALWRSSKMIDEVAQTYGVRPSVIGRWRLFANVWKSIAFMGVSELIADYLVVASSQKILATLSTKTAQGIGAGLYTARIGFKAMELCRPIGFHQDNRPRLKHVFKQIRSYFHRHELTDK